MVPATAAGYRWNVQPAVDAGESGVAALGGESAHAPVYAQAVELLVVRGLHHTVAGVRLPGPVDLSLQSGMRVALTGPAGSGQSVLLRLLAGTAEPAAGTVVAAPGVTRSLLAGPRPAPAGLSAWEHALTALSRLRQLERLMRQAEQKLDTAEALRAYGDLAAEFEAAGGYTAETDLKALLAGLGLEQSVLERPAATLSGGQLRRLELARALSGRPDVLLLDSPDSGLDAAAADAVADLLAGWRGAVVFSSHDRFFINRAASHVAELGDGTFRLSRGGWPSRRSRRAAAPAGGSRRELLAANDLKLALPDGQLLRAGSFTVHTGDRILLTGPNGSGKSSLLRHLARDLHHGHGDSGLTWQDRVSVTFSDQQHHGLDPHLSPLASLSLLMSPQRARQLLALVRLHPQEWQQPLSDQDSSVSARTGLARLLADEADLLILDEADADLDLHGLTLLEEHLLQRPGAVIFASHDRQLARNLADTVFSLESGRLLQYRGGTDGWQAGRLRLEDVSTDQPVSPPGPAPDADPLEQLETELARLEARLETEGVLSSRIRTRLERRRTDLTGQLLELLDRNFAPPAPRFRVREGAVTVQADYSGDATGLVFSSVAEARPAVTVQAGIAHLRLEVPADRCLLPTVRTALVNAAARLCFYTLSVRVVQYWDDSRPEGLLLQPAGHGWYALSRDRFERAEGWLAGSGRRRRRRRRKVPA